MIDVRCVYVALVGKREVAVRAMSVRVGAMVQQRRRGVATLDQLLVAQLQQREAACSTSSYALVVSSRCRRCLGLRRRERPRVRSR